MIRPDLDTLPIYLPGDHPADVVKLSANESPFPPLDSTVDAMHQALKRANIYPAMPATSLIEAVAEHLNLDPTRVAVGCGSSALCQQLVQITSTPDNEVIFPWRSFEAYPIFVEVVGATCVRVPLLADGHLDLDEMAARITPKTSLIFVCNPNNPSGQTITTAEFERFMAKVPDDLLVALDEAYFEFNHAADTPVATEVIERYPNVVGLRTFSKAFGMAGARVGYAFGAPEIITALKRVAIPFSVSVPAQAGAIAALKDYDQQMERIEQIVADRDRVADALGAARSQANFVWLPTPDDDPEYPDRIAEAMKRRNIIVRDFPDGVRITVGTKEINDALLSAWEDAREEIAGK